MMKYIVPIVIVILCYALSWSIAIGLMYLICLLRKVQAISRRTNKRA